MRMSHRYDTSRYFQSQDPPHLSGGALAFVFGRRFGIFTLSEPSLAEFAHHTLLSRRKAIGIRSSGGMPDAGSRRFPRPLLLGYCRGQASKVPQGLRGGRLSAGCRQDKHGRRPRRKSACSATEIVEPLDRRKREVRSSRSLGGACPAIVRGVAIPGTPSISRTAAVRRPLRSVGRRLSLPSRSLPWQSLSKARDPPPGGPSSRPSRPRCRARLETRSRRSE